MKKAFLAIMSLVFAFSLYSCKKTNDTSLTESSLSVVSKDAASDAVSSGTDNLVQKLLLYKTTKQDGLGNVIDSFTLDYDSKGRIVSEVYNNSKTEYQYDDKGNRVKFTQTNNAGKVIASAEYTYDENGNKLSEKSYSSFDNSTGITTYTYDNKNRLSTIVSGSNSKTTTTYTYDDLGGYKITNDNNLGIELFDKNGLCIESKLGDSRALYLYDEHNNMIEEKQYEGDDLVASRKYTYTYNSSDKILERCFYTDGELYNKVLFEYDDNGNLIKTTVSNSIGIVTQVIDNEYKMFFVEKGY